jgi:hypothetical protein
MIAGETRMRIPMLLSVVILSGAVAASDSNKPEVWYRGAITPANIIPTFDNGYLAVYEREGAVSVYSRDGSFAFAIPRPTNGHISNVAVDTDGTAAACIEYHPSWTGGITFFGPTGTPLASVDTGQYIPAFLAFAPDHSVWATGYQMPKRLGDKQEYFVLRHYSLEGKQLGEFWPRSSFDLEQEPAVPHTGLWGLRIANQRIGAYFGYGGHSLLAVWVEGDLSGKETGRWRVDFDAHVNAFTAGGAVYAQGPGGVFLLDRAAGKWNRVSIESPGSLLGADGEALVFAIKGTHGVRRTPGPR